MCPITAASTAYCGSCDLDPSTTACTWVLTAHKELLSHPDTLSYTTYSPPNNPTHQTSTAGLSANLHKSDETYTYMHGWSLQSVGNLCPSHEEIVYSGDANKYTYTGILNGKVLHYSGL